MKNGSFVQDEHKKRMVFTGTAIAMSIGLLCLFRLISPFTFYNNDDVYLQMIVSGDISGTPSPYMMHSHYFLGVLLSSLYRLAPTLPWYGLWICFCVGFCIFCITWRLLNGLKKGRQIVLALLTETVAAFGIVFPLICREQFTALAGFTGAVALFWTLSMNMEKEKCKKSLAIMCVLAGMTYCIRRDVFYMLLPFAGSLWVGKYILNKQKAAEKTKKFIQPIWILLGMLLLLEGTQRIAYSGDWKRFMDFNDSRMVLMDYTGLPDYEEERALYETLGISEETYEAFVHHYMLLNNPDITLENLTKLSETAKQRETEPYRFGDLLRDSMERFDSTAFRLLTRLILVLYLGLLACAVYGRRFRILLQPALLFLVQTGVWSWLNGRGRFPDRVANGLFLIELFGLLAFYFETEVTGAGKQRGDGRLWHVLYTGIAAVCVIGCVHYEKTMISDNAQRAKAMLAFNRNYEELSAYCNKDRDKHYFVDFYATCYYTGDLLGIRGAEPVNMLSLGGWTAKSPLTDKRLETWGIEDAEQAVIDDPQVYVIFGDSSEFGMDYFIEYYEKKYPGSSFEQVDTLTCESGSTFFIYQGKRGEQKE